MLDVDVNWYLPDALLVKVDIATMAHGLEGRSPLLDHKFMEFAATLPSDLKRRGATSKYIFKRAVRQLLPARHHRPAEEGLLACRSITGSGTSCARWRRMCCSTPAARQRGYFRRGDVRRLLDEHVERRRSWHEQLWNLLMLELWHRMFIDDRRCAAPRGGRAPSEATCWRESCDDVHESLTWRSATCADGSWPSCGWRSSCGLACSA